MGSYMKKILSVTALLAVLFITNDAFAWRDCRYGCGYRPGYGAGYDDGFLAGLLVSTWAVLISDTLFHWHDNYKELVMMGADQDAAAFLANGEQPTAVLQSAMKIERELAVAAGEKRELSDEQVAYMIIQHAAMMN